MNKVYGYTKDTGKDWFGSSAYLDNEIESLKDPEGGSEIRLPTAIPSPFARIDLVKTAFQNIQKSPELKAYTSSGDVIAGKDDEKLVSDALDLAEMLFNMDSLKDKLKIIVWDREAELTKLKQGADAHRRLAETMEMYLVQDAGTYNFDLMKRMYLIEYNHKIIGCTSPITLFFATANDLSYARIKLTKNQLTFSDHYTPLYLRDPEFQKYLHLLFKANPALAGRLKIFANYLNKNLEILHQLNQKLFKEINNLKAEDYKQLYAELDTGIRGEVIEVIGVPLRKRKKEDIIESVQASELMINTAKYNGKLKPLVLQNNLNKPFRYINDNWDNSIPVPYLDKETILDRRWLPGVNIQYPYLTVSDFLEPNLVRLVYPINKEKFFDGNVTLDTGDDSKGYLLPLTRTFFDFFDSTDLLQASPDKPAIEMIQGGAGSVKVVLKIPVARPGEYIVFERTYYQSAESHQSKADPANNKGVIVQHEFGIALFPFIKMNNPEMEAYYRVQLVDRDVAGPLKGTVYDLEFYENHSPSPIEKRAKKIRSRKSTEKLEPGTQYYVLDKEFDYIQLSNTITGGASGMIIPHWPHFSQGNEMFSFAVDFGTTNTHVEYKIGNGSPRPLEITKEDLQIATLFHPKTNEDFGGSGAGAIRELINHEFVPQYIGKNSEFRFPHRTVLAESHSLNIETETYTLADFNIPFIYERIPERDKILSNLKWARREKGNEKRIKAYFEKLIMLFRNKVLLNRGNLSQTKLVWFYPSSMKSGRKSSLENSWNELFQKYFKPVQQTIGIAESLAPFYYFKGAAKLQGGAYKPVVSIDIGGGTTDIVVFKDNKPLKMTSFKFAANTIFGDGYSEYGAAGSNGIILKYLPYYENLFKVNNLYDLSKVLASIKDKNRTEDINAFFFSIEKNPAIKDKQLFSYNLLLANDEDLKILVLYFYTAVIFQIAEIMKYAKISLPKHLVFSGTGSKILNIITTDHKTLSAFTKLILEGVHQQSFDAEGLTIETEKEIPKEVTCKGGLMSNTEDLDINVTGIRTTLTCLEDKGIHMLTYDQLNDDTKGSIAEYVRNFNLFFLNLNSKFNFNDHFNISDKSMEILKEELNKHLRDYLEEGLEFNRRMDEGGTVDKELEETLFFYPIIGTINNLATHLSQLTPINN